MRKVFQGLAIAFLFAATSVSAVFGAAKSPLAPQPQNEPKSRQMLIREVRHQLVMLPYYSVFDNLVYKIDDDKVTLEGQVLRPSLKADAEAAVKSIEGVSAVVNNIEVLPPSPADDRIRRATFRAIYGNGGLETFAVQAVPSIHIIVKGGRISLEGVADTAADKNIAGIRANGVPGVFSVTNNLAVTSGK